MDEEDKKGFETEPLLKNIKRNWWLYVICLAVIIFALLMRISVNYETQLHDDYWIGIIDRYCPNIYDMYNINRSYDSNYSRNDFNVSAKTNDMMKHMMYN